MEEIQVSIVRIEPMKVISAKGFGESPEIAAQEKLLQWARSKGLLDTDPPPRFFGFNNPDPEPGNPNYGYELWMTVPDSAQPEDGLDLKIFEGGLYAATDLISVWKIPETWQALMRWQESSRYTLGSHQYLEEHVKFIDLPFDEYEMRLYLPVIER